MTLSKLYADHVDTKNGYHVRAATDPIITGVMDGNPGIIPQRPYTSLLGSFRQASILDFISVVPIPDSTYPVFFQEETPEGEPTPVSEAEEKPGIHYLTWETVSARYIKVAGLIKTSEEVVNDTPIYHHLVDSRLRYDVLQALTNQVLTELTLIFGAGSVTASNLLSGIADGIANVYANNGRPATGIIISAEDFATMLSASADNAEFFLQPPTAHIRADGTTGYTYHLFGLPVLVTNLLSSGSAWVVDFETSVILGERGLYLDSTNSDVDDFQNNLITTRCEWRGYFIAVNPSGACHISVSDGD